MRNYPLLPTNYVIVDPETGRMSTGTSVPRWVATHPKIYNTLEQVHISIRSARHYWTTYRKTNPDRGVPDPYKGKVIVQCTMVPVLELEVPKEGEE